MPGSQFAAHCAKISKCREVTPIGKEGLDNDAPQTEIVAGSDTSCRQFVHAIKGLCKTSAMQCTMSLHSIFSTCMALHLAIC